MKNFREILENNIILTYASAILIGFGAGIAISFNFFDLNSSYVHVDRVMDRYVEKNQYDFLKDKYQISQDSIGFYKSSINQNINSEESTVINDPTGEINITQ